MRRSVKFLVVVVSLVSLIAVDAQAQTRRRSSSRKAGTQSRSARSNAHGGATGQNGGLPPGFGFGTHPAFSGQAGAFTAAGTPAGNTGANPASGSAGTASKSSNAPAGSSIKVTSSSPGFFGRVEQLHGGTYVPGYGVNNGFARPEPVFGGLYVPGYGVNNGFARPESVFGGSYVPGFGVMGNALTSNASTFGNGSAVQGGVYRPGFGVTGGVLNPGGGSFGAGSFGAGSAFTGNYYSPAFGVSGAGFNAGGGTAVQGGSLVPGLGVVSGAH